MAYGDLNYTTEDINTILDNVLKKTEQTFTSEEQTQIQKNIGVDKLVGEINSILDNINGEVI